MTPRSDRTDIEWLTGDEAGAILAELAGDAAPLHTAAERLRRSFSPAKTHLLLEQAELRRRAAAKFTRAQQLFFTLTGLEQATDEWVARYKAQRYRGLGPAVDLCCGIGGDLMGLAEIGLPIGIDADPIAAHFASINSGMETRSIDATHFDIDGIGAWHIDPDRRPDGRRTTTIEGCQPARKTIESFLLRRPDAAIKLAPACRVPAEWIERCELEWISRDGECKQLVAWHGSLAAATGSRRATILSSVAGQRRPPRTVVGPDQPLPIAPRVREFVYDVDAAVVAAKLIGSLSSEFKLERLGAGPTYLTGDRQISDSALSCFRVQAVLPLRLRQLVQIVRERHIGQLEIKKRGVDTDPEKLRRDLKPRGSNAATLLITPIAGRPTAILAHRVVTQVN